MRAICIDKNKCSIYFLLDGVSATCTKQCLSTQVVCYGQLLNSLWKVGKPKKKRENYKALHWVIFGWNLPISWWILNIQENILQENKGPGSLKLDKSLITSLPETVNSCTCGRLDLDSLRKEKGKSVFNIREEASMSGGWTLIISMLVNWYSKAA